MLEYLHFDSIVDSILSRERILKLFINTFMFRAKKLNRKEVCCTFHFWYFFFFFCIFYVIPIGKRENDLRINDLNIFVFTLYYTRCDRFLNEFNSKISLSHFNYGIIDTGRN